MASLNFDASQVAPKSPFAPIPAGTYLAHIIESDVSPLKTGNGMALKLTFEILDGQFKDRKIFNNLNIQHTNPDTQKYAQQDLSAICHATGNIKLTETSALHFKPVKIKVTIRPASGGYDEVNAIKGYESATGAKPATFSAPAAPAANAPVTPPFAPAAAAAPAAPASNVPAWARKTA